MRRTLAGIPVWAILVVGAAGGDWVYRGRKQNQARQMAAAQSQTTTHAAPTGASQDPYLVAYQAGEASGISGYSAGVTSGISLVDSILGMFPAGAVAGQTGQAAAATSATAGGAVQPAGVANAAPALPAQHMMGAGYLPLDPGAAAQPVGGYLWVSSPTAAAADVQQGQQTYYEPAPGVFQPIAGNNWGALPGNTPVYIRAAA